MTTADDTQSTVGCGAVEATVDLDGLIAMHERMALVRAFEERASSLYRAGEIPGFVHLAIGQEASAVGACWPLGPQDVITSTHRGHGHALARGIPPTELFAELMGRSTGVCRGRGGSMHFADPGRGVFGANGIVGAGIPIAGGAAFASRLRRDGGVALSFLGDGALTTGAFHEAANLAALWQLPLVLFCENNRFSEFSRYEDQHPVPVLRRADAYGIPAHQVDGNDVEAVAALTTRLLADVRAGHGPCLVEAVTLRLRGHYDGDPQLYREDDEAPPEGSDPLERAEARLRARGVSVSDLSDVHARIRAEVDRAVEEARAAPTPVPESLSDGVVVARKPLPPARLEPVRAGDGGDGTWKTFQAVRAALEHELEDDPEVFVAGIDAGQGGNVFAITRGLYERWPDRVRDTPISETAIMGLGVGAAMAGMRPVVELMYFDFLGVCLDQLMNQAAKLPFMTGGRARTGLTVRTQIGAGRSSAAQHSQSLEAMVAHVPGLTVVMPSTPADTYGLLRTAIQDPNPVVFVEHRLAYGKKGERCDRSHRVPIGRAAVRRRGDDLTLVSWSRMVDVSLQAAELLDREGVSCEVIDLRTISPMDTETVLESVARTTRLVVVHEAHRDFGVGAEVAARVADEGIWRLDAPIVRVAPPAVPNPYSPSLERAWLPDVDDVVAAARRAVRP